MKITFINDEYVKNSGMPKEHFINSSFIVGAEIFIGIYNDIELLLVSFFHELGHKTDKRWKSIKFCSNHSRYFQESEAWKIGYKMAEKFNISFSPKTKRWAKRQLKTYEEYK